LRLRGCFLVASLGAALGAAAAHAGTGWTLWERPVDAASGQPRGDWQRRGSFEAERWCRGAMTTAINQTLRAGSTGGRLDPKAKISEYQCLPEGTDPRGATDR
jgi:hypothetical protein